MIPFHYIRLEVTSIKDTSNIGSQVKIGSDCIWYDSSVLSTCNAEFFSKEHIEKAKGFAASDSGRGATFFFEHDNLSLVMRQYRRGGLIGKLIERSYFNTGLANTRAWQEINLLLFMRSEGLYVPKPIAARVTNGLLSYQAELITEKIANAENVHDILKRKTLDEAVWTDIGAAIANMHKLQVYHHDLNIHNIMLDDQNKVWIIDFDKCFRRDGDNWKESNLSRLKRSFEKEHSRNPGYHLGANDYELLIRGYQEAS